MKAFDNGFDYMLISDFIDNYGMGIDAILMQSSWSLFLLFIVTVFITGGLLGSIDLGKYKGGEFFIGGATHFWKLFSLSVIFIVIYLATAFIIFLIFAEINNGLSPFLMESETQLVSSFWLCLMCFGILLAFFSIAHNIAKIDIISSDNKFVFKSFSSAFKLLKQHFGSFIGVFLVNSLFVILTAGAYFLLRKVIPCEGGIGLIVLIIVAQIFVISRIALNIVNLASFYFMYKNKLNVVNSNL